MDVRARHHQFEKLWDASPAWQLLRADNAPLILAFLSALFEDQSEVSVDSARAQLEILLSKTQPDLDATAVRARTYLNQWTDDCYLREQNQKLTMTASAQQALNFVHGLSQREMTVTASHLETVDEEMKRLLIALSPNFEEQQRLINERIEALEHQRDQLMMGRQVQLMPEQKRERVRHLFKLTAELAQDFRFLEDEMQSHAIQVHQDVLEGGGRRGRVLGKVLDAEDAIRQSRSGVAFDGFYEMLADVDRNHAFRDQIRRLMDLGVRDYLDAEQSRFFSGLIGYLVEQSGGVLRRRRESVERLRVFMEQVAQEDWAEVDEMMRETSRLMASLRDNKHIAWHKPMNASLATGRLWLASPTALSLTRPEEKGDVGEISDAAVDTGFDDELFAQLSRMQVIEVAERVRDIVRRQGSKTIAELMIIEPAEGGIEEVLALIRIAQATQALELPGTEEVYFTNERGALMRATIPSYVLMPDGFPENLKELNV